MRQLEVTAYHEAGHAIAIRLRGGTVNSVTVEPGLTTYLMPHKRQILWRNGVRVKEPQEPEPLIEDDGFIAYAGSWAETRCRWTLPTVDAKDEHGHHFSEYVSAILEMNTSDYKHYQQATKAVGAEDGWSAELERHWPAIQLVAKRLYAEHMEQKRWRAQRRRWRARRQRRAQVHT